VTLDRPGTDRGSAVAVRGLAFPLRIVLGDQVVVLDGDDFGAVRALGVAPERFLVEFQEGVAPGELREDLLGVVALAEDAQRAGEGLDGVELEGGTVVDGVAGDEEGERAVDPFQVEGLALGGLPGAIERDQAVVALCRHRGRGRPRARGPGRQRG